MADEEAQLHKLIELLRDNQTLPLDGLAVPTATLVALGLEVSGNHVSWPSGCDPLSATTIRAGLQPTELQSRTRVTVLPVVGSTNDWLRAQTDTGIADQVVTAECQVAGKGRLGRAWSTPVGGSIAVSLGLQLDCGAEALGGLSLVVGLAVLEALDSDGTSGLALKWPNDVLVGARKLGGILIEIVRTGASGTELIVGIGLNYRLTESVDAGIDKAVTDLHSQQLRGSRNQLIAAVVSAVTEFAQVFGTSGFEPFKEAFNAVHSFHGRNCQILEGARRTATGRVEGVDNNGRLLLRSGDQIDAYHAGEVSLREH